MAPDRLGIGELQVCKSESQSLWAAHAILSAKIDIVKRTYIQPTASAPPSRPSRAGAAIAAATGNRRNGQPAVLVVARSFAVDHSDVFVQPAEPEQQRDHDGVTCTAQAAPISPRPLWPAPSRPGLPPHGQEERLDPRPVDGKVAGSAALRLV